MLKYRGEDLLGKNCLNIIGVIHDIYIKPHAYFGSKIKFGFHFPLVVVISSGKRACHIKLERKTSHKVEETFTMSNCDCEILTPKMNDVISLLGLKYDKTLLQTNIPMLL